jgi:Leucine-rich repeat (LRR) protein
VNYEKLYHGGGVKVEKLEIFFFGCPHIPLGLNQFPNLHTLCIVNQRFSSISGLEACPKLEELWICETQVKVRQDLIMVQLVLMVSIIQVIEGLHNCRNLIRLHLYSNSITNIDGLGSLHKLEKLWLNGNAISTIEVCT